MMPPCRLFTFQLQGGLLVYKFEERCSRKQLITVGMTIKNDSYRRRFFYLGSFCPQTFNKIIRNLDLRVSFDPRGQHVFSVSSQHCFSRVQL